MPNHELRRDDGILVPNPEGPLEAADFTSLASQVNVYLEEHGKKKVTAIIYVFLDIGGVLLTNG